MKTTVGRIVHYYTKDVSKHQNGQGIGPYPAIVLQNFHGSKYSNLKIMGFHKDWNEGSVEELRINDDTQQSWWVWPPRVTENHAP